MGTFARISLPPRTALPVTTTCTPQIPLMSCAFVHGVVRNLRVEMYQAESSLVTYGDEVISVTRGSPAAVEFDFEAVWDFKKRKGKEFLADGLTWLHVHPPGFGAQASTQDLKCVAALRAA